MITQNVSNMHNDYGMFAAQMEKINYDIQFNKIRRWTKNVDLFNGKVEHIVVPICENDHWSLAIIGKPYLVARHIEEFVAK